MYGPRCAHNSFTLDVLGSRIGVAQAIYACCALTKMGSQGPSVTHLHCPLLLSSAWAKVALHIPVPTGKGLEGRVSVVALVIWTHCFRSCPTGQNLAVRSDLAAKEAVKCAEPLPLVMDKDETGVRLAVSTVAWRQLPGFYQRYCTSWYMCFCVQMQVFVYNRHWKSKGDVHLKTEVL